MAPKKKSLADELADLFNPAPTKGSRDGASGLLAQRALLPPPLPAAAARSAAAAPAPQRSRFPRCTLDAEFDPEADVFGAGPALEESDEELAAAQPARR